MTATLKTARLTLRPVGESDVPIFEGQWTDRDVSRFLFDLKAVTTADVVAFVEGSRRNFEKLKYGLWAVEENAVVVGFCGLRPMDRNRVELLFAFDHALWGRGLATESASAVLAYAHEVLNLPHVHAEADEKNAGSSRVLEKLKMRRIGVRVRRGETLRVYQIKWREARD